MLFNSGHLFVLQGTQAEWQRVFFICSGMYVIGAIFFIVFASGEEQEWAKQKERPEQKQYPATDFTDHDEDDETKRLWDIKRFLNSRNKAFNFTSS